MKIKQKDNLIIKQKDNLIKYNLFTIMILIALIVLLIVAFIMNDRDKLILSLGLLIGYLLYYNVMQLDKLYWGET